MDYQRGPKFKQDTLREAVFYRDNYTYLMCGKSAIKDGVGLREHHIGFRDGDHSDRMGNQHVNNGRGSRCQVYVIYTAGKRKELMALKKNNNKMAWWKKLLAVLVFAAGVSLMAYPWISNWLYDRATEASLQAYEEETAAETRDLYGYWTDAREYNDSLLQADVVLADPFTYESVNLAEGPGYDGLLNLDGSGIMCFVDIPKINVYLPVYHGTSSESLAKGAGHVEGTALPTGTVGGRPIISAHTGVNSAKMFSDLTQLEEGDLFFIHVLDAVYAYRVVETAVIEPDDVSSIDEEPGRDLVTLMTCTPYGVNSHRLIVTGERTAYTDETVAEAESEEMEEDTEWMRAYKKALLTGICIVGLFLAAAMLIRAAVRRRKKKAPGKEGGS